MKKMIKKTGFCLLVLLTLVMLFSISAFADEAVPGIETEVFLSDISCTHSLERVSVNGASFYDTDHTLATATGTFLVNPRYVDSETYAVVNDVVADIYCCDCDKVVGTYRVKVANHNHAGEYCGSVEVRISSTVSSNGKQSIHTFYCPLNTEEIYGVAIEFHDISDYCTCGEESKEYEDIVEYVSDNCILGVTKNTYCGLCRKLDSSVYYSTMAHSLVDGVCTVCGYDSNDVCTTHEMELYNVTQPTYTSAGRETFCCLKCGQVQTFTIPKLICDHTTGVLQNAEVVNEFRHEGSCSVCKQLVQKTHEMNEGQCTVCAYTEKENATEEGTDSGGSGSGGDTGDGFQIDTKWIGMIAGVVLVMFLISFLIPRRIRRW